MGTALARIDGRVGADRGTGSRRFGEGWWPGAGVADARGVSDGIARAIGRSAVPFPPPVPLVIIPPPLAPVATSAAAMPHARLTIALAAAAAAAACARTPAPRAGAAPRPADAVAAKTGGMTRRDGFVPVYLDAKEGKLLLELPGDSLRALLWVSEATGLGSNPVGLDRGASVGDYVARFVRRGERVHVVLENWSYRSSAAGNADHQRTIAESFAPSTVAALPVVAAAPGRLLVDATDFVVHDWLGVSETLAGAGQGSYSLAKDRSAVDTAHTRGFPGNTELDASLTFAASGRGGRTVAQIVPDGSSFTIRQHLSLVPLPDGGYRPRPMDPRVGYFGITFKDFAQPLQAQLEQRWAARHRLDRADPADPASPIVKPIVYYIDRGIPEPVRTATLEGARFWVEAFDAAGLKGAFRVEDLPEGADPMDARYNVVQWINRNERGWSVGGSLGDPRTGQIIKGMARMDSHRARTDYNLYAGLMGADAAAADTAFILARIRQVTAHEIGHTLGLAHNYIASSYERGSVMDYPPPRVRLDSAGNVSIAQAYARGPGAYDVWAVRWGYGIFPAASEADSLRALVAEGVRKNFLFLSDVDARPEYAADPRVNLWDDAATSAEFFRHQRDVRRVAMARFGLPNIRAGEPVAVLQERFAPVYLMHRFAINSLAKAVGGMEYSNAVRGDGVQATRPVPARRQREALALLAGALRPEELAIPDTVLTLLAPRPFAYEGSVELFGSRTRPAFDELGAARTLAAMVIDAVLQRDRAGRLVQLAHREAGALSLGETVDALVAATWEGRAVGGARGAVSDGAPAASSRPLPTAPRKAAALRRAAGRALADRLLALAADTAASPDVRAVAEYKVVRLRTRARARAAAAGDDAERAHWAAIAGDFTRWIERRELPTPTPALVPPPGDPFGEEP